MADEQPAWADKLPDVGAPSDQDNGSEAPAWASQLDAKAPPQRPVAAPRSSAPAAPKAPATPFQKAAAPAPEMSWGDTAQQAVQNLGPSAQGAGLAMWHALTHPVETGASLFRFGAGLGSQAAGAVGMSQDPVQKAKTEALAKAVEHHYAQTYGSVKGLKQAIASDPVSIALDASTLLSGGAGAAGKVGNLEKAATVAGKAASVLDPVANATRVAKVALAPAKKAARMASSVSTGVPESLMKVASQAGATTDPALRGAFLKFYSGQGDPSEFLQAAQGALGQVRQDASDAYLAKKATLSNAQPSFQPIEDAIAKARSETMAGGVNVGQFPAANQALDDVEAMVNGWKTAPDPTYQRLLGFDNLKQALWDKRDAIANDAAKKHLGSIYNAARQAIVDVDPEYANLMEQYQLGRNQIIDTQKTLIGAGKTPSATTALAKSMRALKTPTGKNLLGQLSEKDPSLPYMLAGYAMHPWGAGGKAGLLEGLAPQAAVLTGVVSHDPVLGMGQLVGQAALQSPKIAGAVNFGAGALGNLVRPFERGAYYSGRVGQIADDSGETADETPQVAAPQVEAAWNNLLQRESGDRQFRADGSVVRSPKGALGAAQVMPGTGPVAAKLAGLPWDEQRLETDEAYNKALGKAYFLALIQQYGGDVSKAAAAYNAGPHNVDRALNLAQIKGRHWMSFLPKETREYVPAVVRDGYASGGAVGDRVDSLVKRLMADAKAAQKAQSESTAPLLDVPDEAVVKALRVAQNAL